MSLAEFPGQHQMQREQLDELEGVERIALLPLALHVALAPGATADEPPYVFVEWAPGAIERPYPGTAIWRAVLSQYLIGQSGNSPVNNDPARDSIRHVVAESLERFSSLDAWIRWADHERVPAADSRVTADERARVPVTGWAR